MRPSQNILVAPTPHFCFCSELVNSFCIRQVWPCCNSPSSLCNFRASGVCHISRNPAACSQKKYYFLGDPGSAEQTPPRPRGGPRTARGGHRACVLALRCSWGPRRPRISARGGHEKKYYSQICTSGGSGGPPPPPVPWSEWSAVAEVPKTLARSRCHVRVAGAAFAERCCRENF